jgi:hypothetical protein
MNRIVPRCEMCGKKLQEFESRLVFIEPPINQRDYVFCKECTVKLKNYILKENENGKQN